jgi:hypothetical protein
MELQSLCRIVNEGLPQQVSTTYPWQEVPALGLVAHALPTRDRTCPA